MCEFVILLIYRSSCAEANVQLLHLFWLGPLLRWTGTWEALLTLYSVLMVISAAHRPLLTGIVGLVHVWPVGSGGKERIDPEITRTIV